MIAFNIATEATKINVGHFFASADLMILLFLLAIPLSASLPPIRSLRARAILMNDGESERRNGINENAVVHFIDGGSLVRCDRDWAVGRAPCSRQIAAADDTRVDSFAFGRETKRNYKRNTHTRSMRRRDGAMARWRTQQRDTPRKGYLHGNLHPPFSPLRAPIGAHRNYADKRWPTEMTFDICR